MLKKAIFSVFLCVAPGLSFVACGPGKNPQTDSAGTIGTFSVSSSDTNSDTATDGESTDASTATEGTTDGTSDEAKQDDPYWEEDLGRKFLACDIVNYSIVVYDLDACEGDYQRLINDESTILWEWSSVYDRNCMISPGSGLSSAKFRYSPYYGKDVVIACSSNGWWGASTMKNPR